MATLCRIIAQIGNEVWMATVLGVILITPAVGAEFDVVAVTGQQAPGAEAGVLFDRLWGSSNFPQFNSAGQVLLPAKLAGTGVNDNNDGGLWVVDTETSTSSLIARQGDQAPGAAAGVTFGIRAFVDRPHYDGYMGQPTSAFNDAGQFVYWADLSGPGVDATNDSGMWTGTSSADMSLLARTGDQAVGMPSGVVYTNLLRSKTVINSSGKIGISGRVGGPGVTPTMNEDALWSGTPAGLSLEVRQGDPAPGTTEKFALHKYTGFSALVDDDGDLQIFSSLSADGVWTTASDSSLWSGGNGATLDMLARSYEPAPGLGAGVTLGYHVRLRPTTLTGKFVTELALSGAGVNVFNSGTVWTGTTAGDLSLVARRGDPSFPGSGGNLTFESFDKPVMNESGTYVFRTHWDNTATGGFVGGVHMGTSAEDLELVVGGDQPIPGLDPSLRFGGGIYDLSINNAGQFIFSASISDQTGSYWGSGYFGYDPNQGIELLLQTGEQLEVAAGDWRTVQSFSLYDGGSILTDGTPRGLTDDGQFLIRAYFTDGSQGVVVGSIAVPEPGSLTLLGFGTFAFLVRRRHSRLRLLVAKI